MDNRIVIPLKLQEYQAAKIYHQDRDIRITAYDDAWGWSVRTNGSTIMLDKDGRVLIVHDDIDGEIYRREE